MAVPSRPVAGAPIESAWGSVVHDTAVAMDIQSGIATVQFTGSSVSGVTAITFPRPFGGAPQVVIGGGSGPHYSVGLQTVPTATGFSAQGRRGDGTNQTTTATFHWIAYGPRA